MERGHFVRIMGPRLLAWGAPLFINEGELKFHLPSSENGRSCTMILGPIIKGGDRSTGMNWYFQQDGSQIGPLTDTEFDQKVKEGKVQAGTLVWNETLKGWQAYGTLTGAPNLEVAPLATQSCTQCLQVFPERDMIRFQNSWVCASCKPLFFQKLKEGGVLPGTVEYAGFWPRAGAKIIDSLIISAINVLLMVGLWGAIGISMFGNTSGQPSIPQMMMMFSVYGFMFVFSIAYSVWFLARYGATPGKMAVGLKVVTPEGEPIAVSRAFGRFFAEILSYMICYIGYIMVAFDKEEHKALHDILCNTRVVRK
jgi:uncharacterized RDD family membrane protein YckC